MKLRYLIIALLLACAPALAQVTTVSGSNVQDAKGNKLTAGQACFLATDSGGTPISFKAGGGGQTISKAVCASVVNGAFSLSLPDVDLTNPTNVCFKVTIKETATQQVVLGAAQQGKKSGYECVQPQASNDWCTAGACNFDNYIPRGITTAIVVAGPQGPQGDPGAGFIAGLATDGDNGIAVTNKVVANDVQAKQSPTEISATAYGVKCDNSTDDAAALQAAWNACAAVTAGTTTTPTVRLPAGRCRIGSALTAKNCNLQGNGALNGTLLYWDGPAHGTAITVTSANASRRPHFKGFSFYNGANYPDTFISFGAGILFDQQAPILSDLGFAGSYSHAIDISPASQGFVNAHFQKLRFDSISGCAIRTSVGTLGANNSSWSIDDFTVDSALAPSGNVTPGVFCFDNADTGGGVPYVAPAAIYVANGRVEGSTFNSSASGIVRLNKGTATNGAVGGWTVELKNITTSPASPFTGLVYSEATVTTEMPTIRLTNIMQGTTRPVIASAGGSYSGYTFPSMNYVSEYQSDRTGSSNYLVFKYIDQTVFDATIAGYKLRIRNDANDRIQILPGKILFGQGGATAIDSSANLYWGATGTIKTDGTFIAPTLTATTTLNATPTNSATSNWSRNGDFVCKNLDNTNNNFCTFVNLTAAGTLSSGITFKTTDQTNGYGTIIFGTRDSGGFHASAFMVTAAGGVSSAGGAQFNGGVQPASTGTLITWFQKTTHAAVDLASVASGACTAVTTETITGAALGDTCRVSSGTATADGSFYACNVTAADTVKWQYCNLSGGAIDRASDTYTIRVLR